MNKSAAVFGFFLLAVVVYADPIQFKDCGSAKGQIVSVDVAPCPQIPCQLKKGTNITITMVFKPNEDISAAATTVYGYLNGKIKAPFPLSDNNACHNMQCPIKAGDSITYKNALYVQPLYPAIPVIVQWEVVVGSDIVTCFTVPVVIVS